MRDITALIDQSALFIIIAALPLSGAAKEFGVMMIFSMMQRPVIAVNIIQRKQFDFHRYPIDQIHSSRLKGRYFAVIRVLINLFVTGRIFTDIISVNSQLGKFALPADRNKAP